MREKLVGGHFSKTNPVSLSLQGKLTVFVINSKHLRDFPSGPGVKTPHLAAQGADSILGLRTKILNAVWCSQKEKKKKERKLTSQANIGILGNFYPLL